MLLNAIGLIFSIPGPFSRPIFWDLVDPEEPEIPPQFPIIKVGILVVITIILAVVWIKQSKEDHSEGEEE